MGMVSSTYPPNSAIVNHMWFSKCHRLFLVGTPVRVREYARLFMALKTFSSLEHTVSKISVDVQCTKLYSLILLSSLVHGEPSELGL